MPRTRKQLWLKKGRPAKPADQKLTVRMTFNVTPKEAEVIRSDAKSYGVKTAQYMRGLVVYGFVSQ